MEKWELINKVDKYYFWRMRVVDETLGDFIYNVTSDGREPSNKSGYYNLDYLYQIKGVNRNVQCATTNI